MKAHELGQMRTRPRWGAKAATQGRGAASHQPQTMSYCRNKACGSCDKQITSLASTKELIATQHIWYSGATSASAPNSNNKLQSSALPELKASIRGVSPSSLPTFGSAMASNSARTASVLPVQPPAAAACTARAKAPPAPPGCTNSPAVDSVRGGDRPSQLGPMAGAPAAPLKSRTTAASPAAKSAATRPVRSGCNASAPNSRSTRQSSASPTLAASMSGVSPTSSPALGSARSDRSVRTLARRATWKTLIPVSSITSAADLAARQRGVSPSAFLSPRCEQASTSSRTCSRRSATSSAFGGGNAANL
mmetsp:Transcript_114165/g.355506  ORF Transcript_114165/g.355506 Transcript_114165/m.355506 type:complete len:307 (+) Transcript_114165:98-1018(+)